MNVILGLTTSAVDNIKKIIGKLPRYYIDDWKSKRGQCFGKIRDFLPSIFYKVVLFILNEEPDHLKKHMSVLTKSKNSAKTYLNIPFKKAKSSTSSVKETGQTQAQIEKKKLNSFLPKPNYDRIFFLLIFKHYEMTF